MHKRITALLFAAAASVLCLTGCGEDESSAAAGTGTGVVGTWQRSMYNGYETLELKPDMSCHITIEITDPPPMKTEHDETYSYDGKKLTVHYEAFGTDSVYDCTVSGNKMTWKINGNTLEYTRIG